MLTQLPGRLEYLYLFKNQFNGSFDPTRLPSSMCHSYLDSNSFSVGLRAQRRNIDPRSRRLAGHRPDGRPPLRGGLDQYPGLGGSQEPFQTPRRVSVMAPTLSTAAERWWVRTRTHPWGGSGDRRFLPWGIPDPPGGETRESPLIICGSKHGMR